MDAGKRTAFPEIEEVPIIEKQLSDYIVRPGIDLRLEVIHFDQSIRRRGMAFWETGHTDPETAAIGMRSGFVEFANELDQIDRVLKRVARFVIGNLTGPIASQRENVSDGRVCVSQQNRLDLFLAVADAG